MEIALSIMSFTGGMVIGALVTIVTIIIAVNTINGFTIFHARVLPKAKPATVRKAEIYKAVAKSLKKQKLTWTLKFNVRNDRDRKIPIATIVEDFFYIRTNEIKVVCKDLVSDLSKRGYSVNTVIKGKGDISVDGTFVDDIDMNNKLETITMTVEVK